MDGKKRRITAMLVSLIYIFILLFSITFVAIEADHECFEDNCPVCCQISICNNILKNVSSVSAVALAVLTLIFTALLIICAERHIAGDTLVMLKIKLSD
ncbi:MAG: hypothetical protein LUG95_07345 [Clostridiales bacterium]|nr:hypothetical protein [Clostridiales bacterium]